MPAQYLTKQRCNIDLKLNRIKENAWYDNIFKLKQDAK